MKKITLLIGFLFSFGMMINAQYQKASVPTSAKPVSQATKSAEFQAEFLGQIVPVSVDLSWKPILNHVAIKHHSKQKNAELEQMKKQKTLEKLSHLDKANDQEAEPLASITPILGTNFLGNTNTGNSPMDNSIAVSNGGKIVSVANNSIEFYNTAGAFLFSNSIEAFFNDPNINVVCDPVVIYDSGADKFIFFAQECSGDNSNTNLLICFSATNDPNGNWFKYKITGDPSGSGTWFDYPKMAVSNNELYITGNSFTNAGVFTEALLFQIQKTNGFTGGTLNWQYWHNISADPFTLLPVSFGQQGNYGPGIYLVATASSGASNIDFYDLTNDMSASNEQLNHFSIPTTTYTPAGNGSQLGTVTLLDNGDCRALSGFFLNGMVHFVFHSDYTGGYNGINYNRLDVSTLSNTSSQFGLNGSEYSYPSIASFTTSTTNKSVMIGFGKSNSNIYPQIRVVSCDDAMSWGSSVLVRSGVNFVDFTASGGSAERWGDYTGTARKHNASSATIWTNGMFGTNANDWNSWVAEITGTGSSGIGELSSESGNAVYPNPISQDFKTEFELAVTGKTNIGIYDLQGKVVKTLFDGLAYAGKNKFTFNKTNLEVGTYFLQVHSANQTLINEKIIITE